MNIQAVLFDLDGTLLDRDASLVAFIKDQYCRFSELHSIDESSFTSRFIELDHYGNVWKDLVYQQLLSEFSIKHLDWKLLLEDYISNFHNHCIGFPNLMHMLTTLKSHNIKLALISNGYGQFQYDNFKALKIEHLFDEVLISEWEGLRKPDLAIFQRALTRLSVEAAHALFVGDHPDNDVQASREAGMKAVWKRHRQFEVASAADVVIDDLHEVLDLVLRYSTQSTH
jgi:putative hydrolase of the HAD superfamily